MPIYTVNKKAFLNWGGLVLAFSDQLSSVPAGSTIGLVLKDAKVNHADLVKHHVAFVITLGTKAEVRDLDGIIYLTLPASGAARIDFDSESLVAFLIDQKREVTLRKQAVNRRRTCKECRQLADKGAYKESVKAYQKFIAENQGHYQIDDAHYAIAEILDEHLFSYTEALVWYEKLINQYPLSTLAPLVKQRMKYLKAHPEFEPLAKFERIRKFEFAKSKNVQLILNRVEALITTYPKASITPEMHYWLASQYRRLEPTRAVGWYRTLIKKFPTYENVADAWVEIGETYYQHGQYQAAITAHQAALKAVPDREKSIQAQIRRAKRNQCS